ncbi:MAG: TonB-dependent receptor [Pseudomonadota bacterium]
MTATLPALAQTTLPGIVVTSPSPIVAPPSSAAPSEPVSTGDVSLPPGTLIVAEDTFAPVTVATEREVLATQGSTVTDTLEQKPGITGSTFAAGANRPIIRGLDNSRVRIQENGVGTHDVSALSEDHAIPVDPNAAKRTVVIRGPATLRFGNQAIGGVVSVENNRIPSFVPKHGFTAETKGGISSVDDGHNGAFAVTAGADGIVVHADAFQRRAENYETPEGTQLNTFVESDGYSFGLSKVWSTGFIGVSFTNFQSLYGIPGEEGVEKNTRIDMDQDKIQAKGEFRIRDFGIEAIRFWFGTSDYLHDEIIFDEDESQDIVGVRYTNQETEGRLEIQHLPVGTTFGELTGALGVQVGDKETHAFGVDEDDIDGLLNPAQTRSIAGFLFEELKVNPRLRLQLAGRIESVKVEGTGLSDISDVNNPTEFAGERSFTPASGSVGALYELPLGVVARLNYQYVERAPEAQELYSRGVHEATGTFEIGNPFLEKETANSVELGFKKADGKLRFDSSLYYTRFDNFIFKQFTGVQCGENLASCGTDDELDQILFQQRKADFYGFEIAAQYDVAPIWRGVWGIDGQYDFVRAEFEGDDVARIPPQRVGGGLFYRDANLFARVGVLHAFEQDNVNAEENEQTTPGYTLLNAELSYTQEIGSNTLSGQSTELTIGVKGENLADDDVRNHSSFQRRQGVLEPGASVKVFSKIKFN